MLRLPLPSQRGRAAWAPAIPCISSSASCTQQPKRLQLSAWKQLLGCSSYPQRLSASTLCRNRCPPALMQPLQGISVS